MSSSPVRSDVMEERREGGIPWRDFLGWLWVSCSGLMFSMRHVTLGCVGAGWHIGRDRVAGLWRAEGCFFAF